MEAGFANCDLVDEIVFHFFYCRRCDSDILAKFLSQVIVFFLFTSVRSSVGSLLC